MQDYVRSNGLVRPCCTPENLIVSQLAKDAMVEGLRGDLTVRVCRNCGARHIELSVSPGRAFAEGARV